jgi:hypothetical protein
MSFLPHKIVFSLLLLLSFSNISSQTYFSGKGLFEGRFGVTVGTTNYSPGANFLFSKSAPGYKVGLIGTVFISEKFEVFVEMNYARHFMKFVGREDQLATPEDIKFNLETINVPFILDYTVLNLNDEWFFGINAGPSISLLYDYKLVDQGKADYVLDPLYTSPNQLEFDSNKEKASINAFIALGVSVEYNRFMATFRYNKGISDPYRSINLYSPVTELKGKDNYFEFSLAYFFEDKL